MIPKIIHQTYKNIDKKYEKNSNSWLNKNNDWKYIFYDDEKMFEYLESCVNKNDFKNLKKYLDNCSKIEKIDIFRYLLMYYIGGIYADIDTNCFKSFNNLCLNEDCIFGIESYITNEKKIKFNYRFNYTIGNAILISKKNHPIYKIIINNILNNNYENNINPLDTEYIVQKTGPGLITKTIQNYLWSELYNNSNIREFIYEKYKVKLLEQIYLYPPTKPSIYNIYPLNVNIYSNHICDGNWKINKQENYSTMDYIPYPWNWMYKYKIENIILILSISLNMVYYLPSKFILCVFIFLFSYLSPIIYLINDTISNKKIKYVLEDIAEIIEFIYIRTIFIILCSLNKFKNDPFYLNLNLISDILITYIYHYIFFTNTTMQVLYQLPFIFILKKYIYKYSLLSFLSIVFYLMKSQKFFYISSQKYYSIWFLTNSLLLINVIKDIIS